MGRDTFYNLDEAIENIEGAEYFAPQDVVLLPPASARDEEEGVDNIGLAGNINLLS